MRFFQQYAVLSLAFLASLCIHAQGSTFTHEVKNGETLYSIANLYRVPVSSIEKLNAGSNEGIHVGQKLNIPQQHTAANKPRYHTIAAGETLYRLSQQYGVSTQAICEANPGLSAENFRTGAVVVIPEVSLNVNALSKVATAQKGGQQASSQQQEPRCKDMHKVKRRETISSIATNYNITEQELVAANPELASVAHDEKLKRGTFLCIPFPSQPVKQHVAENSNTFPKKAKVEQMKRIRIAVILPLEGGTGESTRMVEFYRGLLMAVDSMKRQGISVEVHAYNVNSTMASIQQVLLDPALESVDVIFGPLSSEQTLSVAQFTKKHGIKLVLPFTNKSNEVYSNSSIYQLNPPKNYQYANVYEMFVTKFGKQNIIILDAGEKADKGDFIAGLKKALTEKGILYRFLALNATDAQMKSVMNNSKNNIIVSNSSSINTLNQLMPKLLSFGRLHDDVKFSIFGHPEWQTYTQSQLDNFYMADTYIYTSFYRNPVAWRTSSFERQYRKNFHREMMKSFPRFAMLGFDTAYYFLYGLSKYGRDGLNDNLNRIDVTPFQNSIEFERVSNWSGFINRQMMLIHYTRNHTIESIEYK